MQKSDKKGVMALSQIMILLIGIFAFSFLIAIPEVEAREPSATSSGPAQEITKVEGAGAAAGTDPSAQATAVALEEYNKKYALAQAGELEPLQQIIDPAKQLNDKQLLDLAKMRQEELALAANQAALKGLSVGQRVQYTLDGETVFGKITSVDAATGTLTVDAGGGTTKTLTGTEAATANMQTAKGASSPLGPVDIFGPGAGFGDYVVAGALWAVTVYGIVQVAGGILGLSPELTDALSEAAAAGIMAGHIARGLGASSEVFGVEGFKLWGQGEVLGLGAPGIGIAVGIVVFLLTYKKTDEKLVTFECRSWEAPTGGGSCEKCNDDLIPCSEYRCKSLGQACQLLNPGTNEEKCANVYIGDVNSPIIETWKDVLTKEHNYNLDTAIRPPDRGVQIKYQKSSDGCVKAFTPLTFGILTNEPAQCKIDDTRKDSYEEMTYFFGGSNTYKYNHSQTLSLPSPEAINAEAPELQVDGTYNMYVRCQDANGNSNDDLFVFSFCVEKGPDVTPPRIEGTSIANNMPFQYGLTEVPIEVYVNEPADCSWSRVDENYENMPNKMACSQHIYEMNNQMLYKCTTTLTDLEDKKDNLFYFKCRDQSILGESNDRITMAKSYKFVLKGTQPLNIVNVEPNGTITGYSTLATVNLEVKTDAGFNFGDAWCSFTSVENPTEDDYIQMFDTGGDLHSQRLDLPKGEYTYYFQCVDLGGNSDTASTSFNVEIDAEAPVVNRVYQDSGKLKVITDEKSVCTYNTNDEQECSFDIDEGTNMPYVDSKEHYTEWLEGKTYYIKCKDSNERQPFPDECSIIVRAES